MPLEIIPSLERNTATLRAKGCGGPAAGHRGKTKEAEKPREREEEEAKMVAERVKEAKVVSTSRRMYTPTVQRLYRCFSLPELANSDPANYPDPYIYLHVITLHPRLVGN